MYQLDILEEGDILGWWEKTTATPNTYLHTSRYSSLLLSLSTFIEWLEEEEEDDDEREGEDEEDN